MKIKTMSSTINIDGRMFIIKVQSDPLKDREEAISNEHIKFQMSLFICFVI